MSRTLWSAEVSRIGSDAAELTTAGVLILFGEPVPDALADVSVVHTHATELSRPLKAGDSLIFADQTYVLDEVGGRVFDNLTELGHAVVYISQPAQELLPGAIKASGPALGDPALGSTISFVEN